MAKDGWKKIQDRIDSMDKWEIQRVWDHCYVSCGLNEGLSRDAWKAHLYTSAGKHFALAADVRFYASGP